jgi:hypothetical protein
MSRKMSEVSIWSSVLQDIRAAKPRLFRPDISEMPWKDIRQMVVHEAKLEIRLTAIDTSTSVAAPSPLPLPLPTCTGIKITNRNPESKSKLLREMEFPLGELLFQTGFVPNGGGRFMVASSGGVIRLYSAKGVLLRTLPGLVLDHDDDNGPEVSKEANVPGPNELGFRISKFWSRAVGPAASHVVQVQISEE